MKKSFFLILICLLLCGAVAGGATLMRGKKLAETKDSVSDSVVSQFNKLDNRKNQIERKIAALKEISERKKLGKGTVSLICVGAHKKVYNIVYPELKKHNYKGVLVLTDSLFVGSSGCITAEQFSELTQDGWEVALLFSPKSNDPVGDLEKLLERARRLGVNNIKSLYVPLNEYSPDYDSELERLGFDSIVCASSKIYSVSSANMDLPREDKLWMSYAFEYASLRRLHIFSALEDSGGMYSFYISFDSSNFGSYCSEYRVKSFVISSKDNNPEKVQFLTLSDARKYFEEIEASGGGSAEKEEQEIASLEKELAEVKKQLDELRSSIGS